MTKEQKSMRIYESTYQDLVRYKSQISSITGKPVSFDNAIKEILDIATSREYYTAIMKLPLGYLVMGTGRTEGEALQNAGKNTNYSYPQNNVEAFRCSFDFFVQVQVKGGGKPVYYKYEKPAEPTPEDDIIDISRDE